MAKQGLVVFSLPLRLSFKGFEELINPRQHTSLPCFFDYFVYLCVCTCVCWRKSVQRPEVSHILRYHSMSCVFQASLSWKLYPLLWLDRTASKPQGYPCLNSPQIWSLRFGQDHCLTYMDVGVCNQVPMVMQQALLNRAISVLFNLFFFFLTLNFQQNLPLPFVAYSQPPSWIRDLSELLTYALIGSLLSQPAFLWLTKFSCYKALAHQLTGAVCQSLKKRPSVTQAMKEEQTSFCWRKRVYG